MVKYILLALTLISSPLLADAVYVGGFSKHFYSNDLNEKNPLIAVEINDYIVGGFNNSHRDVTIIAAKNFKLKTISNFSAGVIAGVSYGYECKKFALCKNKFMPALAPYVSFTKYNIQPTVFVFGRAAYLAVKINY